jgi:hypothetical protein
MHKLLKTLICPNLTNISVIDSVFEEFSQMVKNLSFTRSQMQLRGAEYHGNTNKPPGKLIYLERSVSPSFHSI